MNSHDGDDITPAGEAPLNRDETWAAWVGYVAQFGSVDADPSTGVFVDDGDGSTAHVMLSSDEIYEFTLASQILSEGLPLQLTDSFFEMFGTQTQGALVTYVRDGWALSGSS